MDKKQIGQLFIVGYQGNEPSDEFLSFVEEWGIGGVIVFARNLDDPEKLPNRLKRIEEAAQNKMFTAVDQEGGLVLRILQGGSLFPSPMAIAAANDPELCEQIYEAIGKEMKTFGLNWNLAPVLDINHKDNPGIGARSFGETPAIVTKFGMKAIKGLKKAGVLACAKHFPGKGHAKKDAHLTLPIIPYPETKLREFELVPFEEAIKNDVDAIMTSHVFFPAFESEEKIPVTMSENVLTKLLRETYGYDGLVVTDDLEMGAITESFGTDQAAERAFLAGADLLLMCHTLDRQRAAAERLLQKANVSETMVKRISQSISRIQKAKSKLDPIIEIDRLSREKLVDQHKPLIDLVSDNSVKFLKCRKEMIPLEDSQNTLFFIPEISSLVQVEEEYKGDKLINLFKEFYPNSRYVVYDPKSSDKSVFQNFCKPYGSMTKVVFCSYNARIFTEQNNTIKNLKNKYEEMALVALRDPYDLFEHPDIRTSAATFGFRTPAIKALLKVLKGENQVSYGPWPIKCP